LYPTELIYLVFNVYRTFFDNCDGIFLNYTWTEENLKTSAENAGGRRLNVYVGVDVFGRNCYGGGGFNSCQVKFGLQVDTQ
jgi:mannosyl-glycoprotein endo-beta-N-acetylglucosaminidase